MGLLRHAAKLNAHGRQNERELADLGQGRGDRQAGRLVQFEGRGDGQCRQRLADDDDAQHAQYGQRLAHQNGRIEQHADRDEEQHGERIPERQGTLGRVVAQRRTVQHQPGEECPEREGVEQLIGDPGNAEGDRQHPEGEQLPRPGMGDADQQPRQQTGADHQHHPDKSGHLEQRPADRFRQFGSVHGLTRLNDQQRQDDKRQHDHQVLDDQPAHGQTTGLALDLSTLLQRPQQDHGRGDREGEPHKGRLQIRHSQQPSQAPAQGRSRRDLEQGARDRDLSHLHQVSEREMQTDAEHQQDDADLRQLRSQLRIGDKTHCVRADSDPGHQIADQGRELQPVGQHAEHEGQHKAADQGENQAVGMRHRRSSDAGGKFQLWKRY